MNTDPTMTEVMLDQLTREDAALRPTEPPPEPPRPATMLLTLQLHLKGDGPSAAVYKAAVIAALQAFAAAGLEPRVVRVGVGA